MRCKHARDLDAQEAPNARSGLYICARALQAAAMFEASECHLSDEAVAKLVRGAVDEVRHRLPLLRNRAAERLIIWDPSPPESGRAVPRSRRDRSASLRRCAIAKDAKTYDRSPVVCLHRAAIAQRDRRALATRGWLAWRASGASESPQPRAAQDDTQLGASAATSARTRASARCARRSHQRAYPIVTSPTSCKHTGVMPRCGASLHGPAENQLLWRVV